MWQRSKVKRGAIGLTAFVLGLFFGVGWAAASRPASDDPGTVHELLERADVQLRGATETAEALWPILTFLKAEARLAKGDKAGALERYRELVQWAADDPHGDGQGGNALAGAALWRWMRLLGEERDPDPQEVGRLVKAALNLEKAGLVQGLAQPSILGALPQFREDVWHELPVLAWKAGNEEAALEMFMETLPSACRWEDEAPVGELMRELVNENRISEDRLKLVRGRCHQSLGRHGEAEGLLGDAAGSEDVSVRTEASFHLAQSEAAHIRSPEERAAIARRLDAVARESSDPQLAQEALYRKAYLHLRRGPGRSVVRFREGLRDLIERYPRGSLADDALYRLALHHQDQGDLEKALRYYERLRAFEGPNDWRNNAAFKPAMALYTRSDSGDRAAAVKILEELEAEIPFGPLHLAASFWLGRMAQEAGKTTKAKGIFRTIVEESPYDYYAIRARMHLRLGGKAAGKLRPGQAVQKSLRTAYENSSVLTSLSPLSPYHRRIEQGLKTGLYALARDAGHRFRERFPSKRMEDLSLEELDRSGLLGPLSLLVALRLDVLKALEADEGPENRLQLAGAVNERGGDHSLSMKLMTAVREPLQVRAELQRQKAYPATAYPAVFKSLTLEHSRRQKVPPELLYAVMRNESLFNPDALSPLNALGLFQFIPSTFRTLDKRWGLLAQSRHATREGFLLDPESNIALGAKWFKEELLKRHGGDVAFAIMEHNAGYPAVRRWIQEWEKLGREGDLEYMIETIPYFETRIFTRRVLRDMILAEAMGLFD